mmetsp:Transcript_17076/g.37635  ORF Transcript_17076/g.37635 Transcript_17076/m.37635 type:complete len:405 (-) Transcript_17076:578-1792(-)
MPKSSVTTSGPGKTERPSLAVNQAGFSAIGLTSLDTGVVGSPSPRPTDETADRHRRRPMPLDGHPLEPSHCTSSPSLDTFASMSSFGTRLFWAAEITACIASRPCFASGVFANGFLRMPIASASLCVFSCRGDFGAESGLSLREATPWDTAEPSPPPSDRSADCRKAGSNNLPFRTSATAEGLRADGEPATCTSTGGLARGSSGGSGLALALRAVFATKVCRQFVARKRSLSGPSGEFPLPFLAPAVRRALPRGVTAPPFARSLALRDDDPSSSSLLSSDGFESLPAPSSWFNSSRIEEPEAIMSANTASAVIFRNSSNMSQGQHFSSSPENTPIAGYTSGFKSKSSTTGPQSCSSPFFVQVTTSGFVGSLGSPRIPKKTAIARPTANPIVSTRKHVKHVEDAS